MLYRGGNSCRSINKNNPIIPSRQRKAAGGSNFKRIFRADHANAGNADFRFNGENHALFERLVESVGDHRIFINRQADAVLDCAKVTP